MISCGKYSHTQKEISPPCSDEKLQKAHNILNKTKLNMICTLYKAHLLNAFQWFTKSATFILTALKK